MVSEVPIVRKQTVEQEEKEHKRNNEDMFLNHPSQCGSVFARSTLHSYVSFGCWYVNKLKKGYIFEQIATTLKCMCVWHSVRSPKSVCTPSTFNVSKHISSFSNTLQSFISFWAYTVRIF